MNASDLKYKVTVSFLEPQLTADGDFIRHTEVTIYEQKVTDIDMIKVIGAVNTKWQENVGVPS